MRIPQVAIGGADPFDDWLSWRDEGKEWRRVDASRSLRGSGSTYWTRRTRQLDQGGGSTDESGRRLLGPGDRVEARAGGGVYYYAGRVTCRHAGGLLDVVYDDGDAEVRVARSLVRLEKPNQGLLKGRGSRESQEKAATAAEEEEAGGAGGEAEAEAEAEAVAEAPAAAAAEAEAAANPRPAPLTAEEAVAQAAAEGITLERSSCASGYKGVRIGVRRESFGIRYEAQVRRARKQVFLGSFATAEEAALAYTRTPEAQAEAAKPKPTSLTAKEAVAQAAAEGFTLQRSNCASGYKGVEVAARVDCAYERYRAKVSFAGKPVFLGCFDTAQEAALAVARANERNNKPTGSPRPAAASAAARRVMQPPKPPPAKPHYTPPPRLLRTMTPPALSETVATAHAPAPLRPNQRVRVWWDDETSFDGRLTDTRSELGRDGVVQQRFQVAYDDGERRWHLEDDVRVDGLAEEVCVDEWVTLDLR